METVRIKAEDLQQYTLQSFNIIEDVEINLYTVSLLSLAAVNGYSREKRRLSRKGRHILATAIIPDVLAVLRKEDIIGEEEEKTIIQQHSESTTRKIVETLSRAASYHSSIGYSSRNQRRSRHPCVVS